MQTLEQLGYEKQNEFGRDYETYQKRQDPMTIQIAIDHVDKTIEKSHFFSGDYDATESSYSEALSMEELQASMLLLKERTINRCEPVIIDAEFYGPGFTVNGFHFVPVGVDGIYILDRVAFKAPFDEDGGNDWEKSTGKRKLQKWAEKNLPKEGLERFEVDLPTVEEIFSQKMINLYNVGGQFKSKQFPIFQNSDNRMMELEGKSMWWTRCTNVGSVYDVWCVSADGTMYTSGSYNTYGFVPVLRRKENINE